MEPIRLVRDARDLYKGIVELLAVEEHNENASYEIAVSARDFSRDTQAAVDDKLNFSATLMRAGEVEAANRLLEEFHNDVRDKEVALIEKVNEVKAAEAVRKASVTRVRLARMLAVAILGAGSLSMSAAGMALAGLMRDRAVELQQIQTALRSKAGDRVQGLRLSANKSHGRDLRRVSFGRLELMLSASELRTIRELTGNDADGSNLQDIIGLLPDALAEKVQRAIVVASEVAEDTSEQASNEVAAAEEKIQKIRLRRKARNDKPAEESKPEPKPEESEEPAPAPTEPTGEEDSPAPEESPTEDDEEDRDNNDDLPIVGRSKF